MLIQQGVVFSKATGEHVENTQNAVAPSVGKIGSNAAGTDVVVVHAEASDFLKEAKRLFAFTPSVKHHRHCTEVHAVGGHEEKVRRNAIHLGHEHADPDRTFRDFDIEQLFDSKREGKFGEQRRCVIHTRHVGGALQVSEFFTRALHACMEVADDRLTTKNGLALEFEHETQHAMSRRMLRTHVDDHGFVVGNLFALGKDRVVLGQSKDGTKFAKTFASGDNAG